jgi:hypothetical protein
MAYFNLLTIAGKRGTRIIDTIDHWHYVGGSEEPAFLNSWVNLINTRQLRFIKLSSGFVIMQGAVGSGTSATAEIFYLPSGYIPLDDYNFFPCRQWNGATGSVITINIRGVSSGATAGQVTSIDGTTTTEVHLDITFFAGWDEI